jgi:hypothetical protein
VPRHVARLVTRLAALLVIDYSVSCRLIVDYSASRRLVVDYFASATRPVPQHVARLVTRLVVPLVVDYFAYAACLGASASRAARHVARRAARCRQHLAQARH